MNRPQSRSVPSYISKVPGTKEFSRIRNNWRAKMSEDQDIRNLAVSVLVEGQKYNFGYQWEWCGVPIIRYPEDLLIQQELMWSYDIRSVIETGIARGGSVIFSATMLEIKGIIPRVLGIDIMIHEHAHEALSIYIQKGSIEVVQCSSTSEESKKSILDFLIDNVGPTLVILDSDHGHAHVLEELRMFSDLIPTGSIIMVADTIIEEMPAGAYPDRNWSKGSNPYTALTEFLQENDKFRAIGEYHKRGLLSEFRNGIIIKMSQ